MRLSSKSDHHDGYDLVLAYISVIFDVVCRSALPLLNFVRELFRLVAGMEIGSADKGSTWTISSQTCTIALMRDVLPTPVAVSHVECWVAAEQCT